MVKQYLRRTTAPRLSQRGRGRDFGGIVRAIDRTLQKTALPCAASRYVKQVGADETTLRFWQEIFDEKGRLAEIHEKYPVDKGHQKA